MIKKRIDNDMFSLCENCIMTKNNPKFILTAKCRRCSGAYTSEYKNNMIRAYKNR